MVRWTIEAIKSEQILPTSVGPEEIKRLLKVEKSAAMLSLAVSLHELDSARDKAKLKEIEKGGESDR